MASGMMRGAFQGGIAMAPTANPWMIGAGLVGGGLLGYMDEQEDKKSRGMIGQSNALTLEGMRQQNQMGALNLMKARRMNVADLREKKSSDIIGNRLSELFSRLRG